MHYPGDPRRILMHTSYTMNFLGQELFHVLIFNNFPMKTF